MFNIVLLGPPGVGKGTQGMKLKARYGIPVISTGDILREAVRKESALGVKAKGYMDRGELVPDDVVVGIVGERLKRDDCYNGFILDGFPRTITQAEALEELLKLQGKQITHVITLDLPKEEIIKRLEMRRLCKVCGSTYHLLFNPPASEGRCDRCGGDLYQRADDDKDTILARLKIYDSQTLPLIDFYERKGFLNRVSAADSIEGVFERITRVLEKGYNRIKNPCRD